MRPCSHQGIAPTMSQGFARVKPVQARVRPCLRYRVFSFARAHGSTPSSSNWNPLCDLNGDGLVDENDFALFLTGF